MSISIEQAIYKYGVVNINTDQSNNSIQVFAYEIDGFGNVYKMDDANIPGLLSLPYIGFVSNNDAIYLNTRKLILNQTTNPYYF